MKKVLLIGIGALSLVMSACSDSDGDSSYSFVETQLEPTLENFRYAVTSFDQQKRTISYYDLGNGADECIYDVVEDTHTCEQIGPIRLNVLFRSIPRLALSKTDSVLTVFGYNSAEDTITFDASGTQVSRSLYHDGKLVFQTASSTHSPSLYNHYAFAGFPVGGQDSCSNGILNCGNGIQIDQPRTLFENGAESITVEPVGTLSPKYVRSRYTVSEAPETIPEMPTQQLVDVLCVDISCKLDIKTGELWQADTLLETLALEFLQGDGYYQIDLPESSNTSTEHLVWAGHRAANGSLVEQWASWPTYFQSQYTVKFRAVSQQAFDDIVEELSF